MVEKAELFPPGHYRGAKKSPSGLTPEGLKSFERSEPSRRVCGGYDGYYIGGKAKAGADDHGAGVIHMFG